jgi:hypothetical protein
MAPCAVVFPLRGYFSSQTRPPLRRAAEQPVALVGFYGFFVEKSRKNHDYRACFGSLQGKKSPFSRFFGVLCAKRNKLRGNRHQRKIPPEPRAFFVFLRQFRLRPAGF